jgi:hypothetical protein
MDLIVNKMNTRKGYGSTNSGGGNGVIVRKHHPQDVPQTSNPENASIAPRVQNRENNHFSINYLMRRN